MATLNVSALRKCLPSADRQQRIKAQLQIRADLNAYRRDICIDFYTLVSRLGLFA